MQRTGAQLSRREFIWSAAGAAVAVGSRTGVVSSPEIDFRSVRVSPDCQLPVLTAAQEISDRKSLNLVRRALDGEIREGEITLATVSELNRHQSFLQTLPAGLEGEEWESVKLEGGGVLIAGSSPRNVCRAALAWLESPAREMNRLSVFQFSERFTMWDNGLNQLYRFSRGFDRRQHLRQIALLGHTGVEINRYADPGGYHVRHRKFPHDSYAWYLSYAPALDAYVESSLTQGIYPQDELLANLRDLREASDIAASYGLKPGFVCYEPRCVSDKVFERHPQLRGSRTDHPGRSLQPRYALDIANPIVLKHYDEMLTKVMREVPELRYLVFWTGDSGSGLPFASRLYFGPNGSYLARSKRLEQMAADFSGTLLQAGRRVNPEFEVIMEIGWEYTEDERRRITGALPEGVTVSHMLGGGLLKGGDFGDRVEYLSDDREIGVEPYGGFSVSSRWDPEPIMGVPAPSVLVKKFENLRRFRVKKVITEGGVLSPPQCPYSINQRLYTELLRGEVDDVEGFLLGAALEWCDEETDSAEALVAAWKKGDEALQHWPALNWYHSGAGQTQGRWITRPVVPDITRLSDREREAWERSLFTLPWDIGRQNIVFEGGIRMYREEQLEQAVGLYDKKMLPLLEETLVLLESVLDGKGGPVIRDQRDRYLGLLLRESTTRNLFESQVAINLYLMKQRDPALNVARLRGAIEAEIDNTKRWIAHLETSPTTWFRTTDLEETPFLYKTPLEDLQLKLAVMEEHREDEPGPFLEELFSESSEAELLFWNGGNTLEGT